MINVLLLTLFLSSNVCGHVSRAPISEAMLEVSWAEFDETRASRSICLPREDARKTILGRPLMFMESASDSGSNVPQREALSAALIPQIILCVPLTGFVETAVFFAFMDGWQEPDQPVPCYLATIGAVTAVSGPAIWGIGRLFGGRGSFFKTILGTGIGTVLPYCLYAWDAADGDIEFSSDIVVVVAVMAGIPVLGGIVGFNLR